MAEKRFKGAPFGGQSARFDVSGTQPARKTHTYTEMLYGKKRTTDLERKRGPGTYNPDSGDFSTRAVQERAKGPGWKREQEIAQFSKTPPALFYAAWEEEQFLKTKLGPGSYKILDFTEMMRKKPQSVRGVCATGVERFRDYVQSETPGPGTYGKGGIPDALVEEKRKQSAGMCPTMDFSYGVERYPYTEIGSGLSPCTYDLKSSTDLLLSRKAGVWKSKFSERQRRSFDPQESKLGPGTYNVDLGAFSAQAVQERAKGPGWKRAQEIEQFSKAPPVLYLDMWEKEQFLKTKLGPGSYKICDFAELMRKKPRSTRGVCATREERFKDYVQSETPGPGTYGKGGIPDALVEEKRKQSAGTCPTMDFSYGVERYPYTETGSGISPCMYNLKSCTDLLLRRKAGVWKSVLSERQNKPFDSLKEQTPDPGQYIKNIIVFGEDFKRPEKKMHGLFGKLDQYPARPTERIYHSTLSQCPRPEASPGPGHYNAMPLPRVENRNPPPFLMSARRFTKRSQAMINRNFNTVGPGRYYIAVPDNKILNSHHSVFKSGSQRYLHNLERDRFMRERLKPIKLPKAAKSYFV